MRINRAAAVISVALALLYPSSPGWAVNEPIESGPVIDGTLDAPVMSVPVKLKLVRDDEERSRVLTALRSTTFAAGLLLPISPPKLSKSDLQCEVTTESVHARKSANYEKIGPKPKTTCPRTVQLILHTTWLRYLQAGRWIPVLPEYSDSGIDRRIHRSLGIQHPCRTLRRTKWSSETVSYVVDRGQVYKGSVRAVPRFIACSA